MIGYSGLYMKVNTTFRLSSTSICTTPDQVGLIRPSMYPSNQHKGYDFVIGEVILSTSHKRRPPRSVFDDSSPLVLV